MAHVGTEHACVHVRRDTDGLEAAAFKSIMTLVAQYGSNQYRVARCDVRSFAMKARDSILKRQMKKTSSSIQDRAATRRMGCFYG